MRQAPKQPVIQPGFSGKHTTLLGRDCGGFDVDAELKMVNNDLPVRDIPIKGARAQKLGDSSWMPTFPNNNEKDVSDEDSEGTLKEEKE